MPEHFHFSLKYVHPKPDRCVALDKSTYARRVRERDLRVREPVRTASDYMRRTAQLEAVRSAEVAASLLLTNGWEVSPEELWTAVDHANKAKNGEYKKNAGKDPRIAQFGDASFPRGVTEEAAVSAMKRWASAVADKYGCAIQADAHRKEGKIDHCHFLISDRKVSPSGVSKTKIREFNGVASKLSDQAVRDGDVVLSASMEWMRSLWAAEMRAISGNQNIRHESFKRQGLDETPVTYFDQSALEAEKHYGTSECHDLRAAEMAARNSQSNQKKQIAELPSQPPPTNDLYRDAAKSAETSRVIGSHDKSPQQAAANANVKPSIAISAPSRHRKIKRDVFSRQAVVLALNSSSPPHAIAYMAQHSHLPLSAAVLAAHSSRRKKKSRDIGEAMHEDMAEMHHKVDESLKANALAATLREEAARDQKRNLILPVHPRSLNRPRTDRQKFFVNAAVASLLPDITAAEFA